MVDEQEMDKTRLRKQSEVPSSRVVEILSTQDIGERWVVRALQPGRGFLVSGKELV